MASRKLWCNVSRDLNSLCTRFMSLQTRSIAASIAGPRPQILSNKNLPSITSCRQIQTSSVRLDLMEFFDEKTNWGQNEVKSGRAWTVDELRIKSNADLHKLWFILLKESNMLKTMEHESIDKTELFPSPERIDKVKLSMDNLELVVRERNKAYHLLETGINGERPGRLVTNQLGVRFFYRETEHLIPKVFNKKWQEKHVFHYQGAAVLKFRKLYREKIYNEKRKARNRERNQVMMLLRRYPHLSHNMLKQKYPSVNIDKLIREDKCSGHFAPPELKV